MAEQDLFDSDSSERREGDPALIVGVDGFEGPLDLLLELARRQKVDLHRISILALADQYLQFVEAARKVRLELAADYLVMAAWLAYLKSRLLLPKDTRADDGPSAEEMAGALAERLRKLEAIRLAAQALMMRPQLGQDVFGRGEPEDIQLIERPQWEATLHDLLSAYARQRQKHALARVTIEKRFVWSLSEAREALERLIGQISDWAPMDAYLLRYAVEPSMRKSVSASSFASVLELVRDGSIEIRQDQAFDKLWLRRKAKPVEPATAASVKNHE
ncbi:MAG: segregation and condensation protein A [Beijerinckiaceae bacterium]